MKDTLTLAVDRFIADSGTDVLHPNSIANAVRIEKACIICDIVRVTKASQCLDSVHARNLADAVAYFDRLYELSILELEIILAQMCAKLSRYMKAQVMLANSSPICEWNKNDCNFFSGDLPQ